MLFYPFLIDPLRQIGGEVGREIPASLTEAWGAACKAKSKAAKNKLFTAWLAAGGEWGQLHGCNTCSSLQHEQPYTMHSCTYSKHVQTACLRLTVTVKRTHTDRDIGHRKEGHGLEEQRYITMAISEILSDDRSM